MFLCSISFFIYNHTNYILITQLINWLLESNMNNLLSAC